MIRNPKEGERDGQIERENAACMIMNFSCLNFKIDHCRVTVTNLVIAGKGF